MKLVNSSIIIWIAEILLISNFYNFLLAQEYKYNWLNENVSKYADKIFNIPPPPGFSRVKINQKNFAGWLRHLPLKKDDEPVYLFNGQLKTIQNFHFRIIDVDIGKRNIQQCADAVIRLRAEYLFSQQNYADIIFNFTSGDPASYSNWKNGFRPKVNGNEVKWIKKEKQDSSYQTFRSYLNAVFVYAGSYSLNKELIPVTSINDIQIGDVFIKGGFPGHAMLVVDMVVSENNSQKAILLAQSYMPAQNIHIIKNLNNKKMNPWYIVGKNTRLITPEWNFLWTELKRFR